MSLLIGDNLVVSMHYKLTDDDNKVLDTSEGAEPLNYLHGSGNIIPGLENALIGKTEGATLKVRIEPAEAYGEIVPELIQTIDKSSFQGVDKVEAGMQFQTQTPDGQTRVITVKGVEGDQVTIDANHPLAGIALTFDVEVISVREASADEISHGHVH